MWIFLGLTSVSLDEILSLQREKAEEKERFEEARNRAMKGRGRIPTRQSEMILDDQ